MACKVCRSDVIELTVFIIALAQIFTAVLQPSCHRQRTAWEVPNRASGSDGPLDNLGAIVLDLLSSQRIIELLIGMYVKILVGERVKVDTFKSRKSSI